MAGRSYALGNPSPGKIKRNSPGATGRHVVFTPWTAGFAQADVDTRTGKAAGAERDLSALYDQAKRDGYAVFELEARLLLAQAEFASGKPAAARAHLEKLQLDARNKGFLLIARKAGVARPR